uniref:Uncharacterized protein n=1 Tax=Aureoumbra lagunensis TaxID=44058 RepID=A0A7S3JUZ7_9STRA
MQELADPSVQFPTEAADSQGAGTKSERKRNRKNATSSPSAQEAPITTPTILEIVRDLADPSLQAIVDPSERVDSQDGAKKRERKRNKKNGTASPSAKKSSASNNTPTTTTSTVIPTRDEKSSNITSVTTKSFVAVPRRQQQRLEVSASSQPKRKRSNNKSAHGRDSDKFEGTLRSTAR